MSKLFTLILFTFTFSAAESEAYRCKFQTIDPIATVVGVARNYLEPTYGALPIKGEDFKVIENPSHSEFYCSNVAKPEYVYEAHIVSADCMISVKVKSSSNSTVGKVFKSSCLTASTP